MTDNGGIYKQLRRLPQSFISDLKNEGGILRPLLVRVRQDDTLLLSIRDGYINTYYRGGSLARISYKANGTYKAFFDRRYNKTDTPLPALPDTIKNLGDTNIWIAAFPKIKEMMDISFSINNKPEREFQQLIARENNRSTISNETEYFVTDIEFADSSIGARFDLLAVRWLASQRRNNDECLPALIELKYGDGTLGGNAGLIKHLEDVSRILSDREKYESILQTMQVQFEQLDELGLVKFKKPSQSKNININSQMKPQVIVVLANHNPRSKKLLDIIDSPKIKELNSLSIFDLKFFAVKFAGYGFHQDCMASLEEFQTLLLDCKSSD
jgi:hypothetical protein